MGIYIKDAEKPSACDTCTFAEIFIDEHNLRYYCKCSITKNITVFDMNLGRDIITHIFDDCPIEEVEDED